MRGREPDAPRKDRGQLVLLAAAVLAIALVPVLLAYLQLGYHGDVTASADYESPGRSAERYLDRAVHEASTDVHGNYSWADRADAIERVRSRLDPRLTTLSTARVESGTATRTAYNQSAAQAWASANCPDGPNRQFGGCEARRGVVVQEREGETHVLAVALDVTITTERGTQRLTLLPTVPSE
ncbi:DUF7261 family protein [Halorientalis salina]|uniref:DUF7261 family protein n=1 Tax=Halorientalis salina TaxID=2932266 RepID=UPI0010ABE946|nr:hypothetical protein [Halorientalis salina]